jgi:hypothetical protein
MIKNNTDKICILIDMATAVDRNLTQKETETKLKCKHVSKEIQQMWNFKCRIETKGLKEYMETKSGKHSTDCVQKQLY